MEKEHQPYYSLFKVTFVSLGLEDTIQSLFLLGNSFYSGVVGSSFLSGV
jgi:hypothetical protein